MGILVTFAVQLSGGWDEVLDRTHPRPGDPEVVAAREAAAAEVDAEIVRVIDEVVTPTLTGGRVAEAPAVGAAMAPVPNDRHPGATRRARPVWWASTTGRSTTASTWSAPRSAAGSWPHSRSPSSTTWSPSTQPSPRTATPPRVRTAGCARPLDYWQSLAGTPAGTGEYGIANLPGAMYRSAEDTFTLFVKFGPPDTGTPALDRG